MLTKKDEIVTITNISIEAFNSDSLVGLDPNDGPPGYNSLKWHQEMQSQKHLYSYIDDSGEIIGGAILFCSPTEVYVGRIFISPKYHRKGYGIKLMNDIENMFSNVKTFKLDTPEKNIRTNNFYTKLGYKKCGFDGYCVVYMKQL